MYDRDKTLQDAQRIPVFYIVPVISLVEMFKTNKFKILECDKLKTWKNVQDKNYLSQTSEYDLKYHTFDKSAEDAHSS